MKRTFRISLVLVLAIFVLASCGADRTSGVADETPDETSAGPSSRPNVIVDSIVAFVSDKTDPEEILYIQSLSCPADIMDYAAANAARFVMSMDETSSLDYSTIQLGQPFTYGYCVPNLFTFPVFSGDTVIYTLRVAYAPDGTIHGTASTFLVDELNAYMGETAADTPLLLDVINNALYACIGAEAEKICDFPANESIPDNSETEDEHFVTMEIRNISDFLTVDFSWEPVY